MISCFLLKVKFSPSQIVDPDLKKMYFLEFGTFPPKFVKIRPNEKLKTFTILTYIFWNKSIM